LKSFLSATFFQKHCLHSKFQAYQEYIERFCLKRKINSQTVVTHAFNSSTFDGEVRGGEGRGGEGREKTRKQKKQKLNLLEFDHQGSFKQK
jgi:hypothetical protein